MNNDGKQTNNLEHFDVKNDNLIKNKESADFSKFKAEVMDMDDISKLNKDNLHLKVNEAMRECYSDPKVLKNYRKRRAISSIILIILISGLITALVFLSLLVYWYSRR